MKFKEYKDSKKAEHLGTNPSVYQNREEVSAFEQKPITTDDFPKEEEERIAEKMKKEREKDAS